MKRLLLPLIAMVSASPVYADGGKMIVSPNAKWQEECGSCHIAYPPQRLTATDWQKLMGGLDRHFGANASLDAADNKEILDFLMRHAGSGERYSASTLRISDTPWFRREHRSISPKEWTHPEVKSRANCSACHQDIAHAKWSERNIDVPGKGRWKEHDDD